MLSPKTIAGSLHLRDLLLQHLQLLLVVGVGQLQEHLIASLGLSVTEVVMAVASDSARQFHVLLLNSKTLGVDGAQVGVLEQAHDVGLGGFLERDQRLGLETKVGVDSLSDLANDSLERSTREKHVHRLLVLLDLAKRDSAWLVVALSFVLHPSLSGRGLLDRFGLERLPLDGDHLGLGGFSGNGLCLWHSVWINLN